MKRKYLLLSGLALLTLGLNGQSLKEGYIASEKAGEKFQTSLQKWNKGDKLTEDDNFFISRVKPKRHFRNAATQVNQAIDATNDKKLVFWVPINNVPFNALPDGKFDSEVFPMWNYVTHYGNWTAGFVRMPGNFADVAHKNGVTASVVAGIPFGSLTSDWRDELNALINIGPDKMADFLTYYGIDGLGYNSEFSGSSDLIQKLQQYHGKLVQKLKTSGVNPIFENMWYDGTSDEGGIHFDGGLGTHNDGNFGDSSEPRSSLFFNYNWNNTSLIDRSIAKAKEMGRDPLDLYVGMNMQGAEPKYGTRWPLLEGKNLSIGLWGAHSQNMFFESRGEKGSLPEVQQSTYLKRVESWFTGGTRNPVNTPAINNSMSYTADNPDFFGMSKFMSARSSLKWDLSEEPFISYFNLGNGKFFNWNGERQNNKEWYNIGVQDYLPTWRWWFTDKFMGREASDVPTKGLNAEFSWEDAWMGGSLMRVFGAAPEEYLHLFKTEFALRSGDVITVRYKLISGKADLSLALSAKGDEKTVLAESSLNLMDGTAKVGDWVEKKFTIRGALNALNGKEIAMIALHFKNAENLNLYVGEFSIVRGTTTSAKPATPVIEKTQILNSNYKGVDGKIIFNMPNDKGTDVCYNLDVKTSLFKLYAQQEGKDPVLMGVTTSWAGMYYGMPIDFSVDAPKVRLGVSAMSLDMKAESEIAWSDYSETGTYSMDDNISLNKTTIKPNEDFEIAYVDSKHEVGTWELLDATGKSVKKVENAQSLSMPDGLPAIGNYTLKLTGIQANAEGNRVETVRTFGSFVQVSGENVGALPKIISLTADGKDADVKGATLTDIDLKYTGRKADGIGSKAVQLSEKGFGFLAGDMKMQAYKSFSLSFWVKINKYIAPSTQFINIRDKKQGWPLTDWGWCWNNTEGDGKLKINFRKGAEGGTPELSYEYANNKIEAGPWTHMAYVFEYDDNNAFKFTLYLNGEKIAPSKWLYNNAEQTGDPRFMPGMYGMRPANVVALGGPAFGRGGIDGSIDNFQYWEKAMTAEDVKKSMETLDATNLPAELKGFWSFEKDAAASGEFDNEVTSNPLKAGLHVYDAGASEGEGSIRWESATYSPGCPFITGTAYPVVTEPSWSIYKGDISNNKGNDLAGSAKVQFAEKGSYEATLTLKNGWGSDSKTFKYIVIDTEGSVDDINVETELQAYPNPFIDHVNVKFGAAGNYTVRIFNANGVMVNESNKTVDAGQFVQIGVNSGAGAYIAQILKDGKLVRAVKLLKK